MKRVIRLMNLVLKKEYSNWLSVEQNCNYRNTLSKYQEMKTKKFKIISVKDTFTNIYDWLIDWLSAYEPVLGYSMPTD